MKIIPIPYSNNYVVVSDEVPEKGDWIIEELNPHSFMQVVSIPTQPAGNPLIEVKWQYFEDTTYIHREGVYKVIGTIEGPLKPFVPSERTIK